MPGFLAPDPVLNVFLVKLEIVADFIGNILNSFAD